MLDYRTALLHLIDYLSGLGGFPFCLDLCDTLLGTADMPSTATTLPGLPSFLGLSWDGPNILSEGDVLCSVDHGIIAGLLVV